MGEPPRRTGRTDDRRRARLRDELQDVGLRIPPEPVGDLLVDELAYALWAGVHEHRRFGYGCVLDPRDHSSVGEPLVDVAGTSGEVDLEDLRRYADGERIFLLRSPQQEPEVVTVQVPDQLALVRLHRRTGGTVVRRLPRGVQVVTDDGTVASYAGRWALRPSSTAAVDAIGDAVGLRDRDVLCQILDLCLHVLSPRHVGATVVWRLARPVSDRLARSPVPGPLRLTVADDRHLDAVAKRVALLDGACVLERDGTVTGFGAFLGWSDASRERMDAETGLRHSSARWYSADVPEALVFVVSEDGPVTVYSRGSAVLGAAPGAGRGRPLRGERAPW